MLMGWTQGSAGPQTRLCGGESAPRATGEQQPPRVGTGGEKGSLWEQGPRGALEVQGTWKGRDEVQGVSRSPHPLACLSMALFWDHLIFLFHSV